MYPSMVLLVQEALQGEGQNFVKLPLLQLASVSDISEFMIVTANNQYPG